MSSLLVRPDTLTTLEIPGSATNVGLVLPSDLEFEEWEGIGRVLTHLETGVQWWLGDWLNYGERRWGDKYTQAIEVTGAQYQTLADIAWTAKHVDFSLRKEKLSFSHHKEVAALPPGQQKQWLERAEIEGYSAREFRQAIKRGLREAIAATVEERREVAEETRVKRGEWWQLGRHLLFCGDTSSPEFYSGLPKADFGFADPPYNAEAAEWDSGFVWNHDWLEELCDISVVTPGIVSIFDFARMTQMPYKWALACWISNGMTRGALGFGNWIYGAVFSRGSVYRQAQDFVQVTINNAETSESLHKGRKPAAFLAWLLETFTHEDEEVIDPFLGSGTTLLVAHRMGRTCYGGEIRPDFCSDIVTRWEAMSGQKAVKT